VCVVRLRDLRRQVGRPVTSRRNKDRKGEGHGRTLQWRGGTRLHARRRRLCVPDEQSLALGPAPALFGERGSEGNHRRAHTRDPQAAHTGRDRRGDCHSPRARRRDILACFSRGHAQRDRDERDRGYDVLHSANRCGRQHRRSGRTGGGKDDLSRERFSREKQAKPARPPPFPSAPPG